MFNKDKAIWLTWEHQRRSVELANFFGVLLLEITCKQKTWIKQLFLSFKTISLLIRRHPETVFVQNPSLSLAALVCFLKKIFRFKVIVDRHSNFIFSEADAKAYSKIRTWVGTRLSNYSMKRADLTIVTNRFIANLVEEAGGKSFILQDKLPEFDSLATGQLLGKYNVIFPCTFSPDEPIEAVIAAAEMLDGEIFIYITGNYQKYTGVNSRRPPKNIIFTGYVSEKDYAALLQSGTMILALTTRPHTLLCSAYESVSLCKPFIVSNQDDLREYFSKGNVPTQNNAHGLSWAIKEVIASYSSLLNEVVELRKALSVDWGKRSDELIKIISKL